MSAAPNNRSFTPRRPDTPRRVRAGIKYVGLLHDPASPRNDFVAEKARRLQALIESRLDSVDLSTGLEFAKSGQTVSVDFSAGMIEARIQDTAARPFVTAVHLPALNAEQWHQVIQAMASEAVYSAKLLSGEVPASIDDLLATLNLSLLPSSSEALTFRCACPAPENSSCKHIATLACVAAEQLAQRPLHLITLLGKSPEQLLEHLTQQRTIETHGVASAHRDSIAPEASINSLPLEACIDEFWRSPQPLEDSADEIPLRSPHVPHALLRRLGPSPMQGKFPLVGLLASVYDTVSEAARKLSNR